jgi:hypothetical protein
MRENPTLSFLPFNMSRQDQITTMYAPASKEGVQVGFPTNPLAMEGNHSHLRIGTVLRIKFDPTCF